MTWEILFGWAAIIVSGSLLGYAHYRWVIDARADRAAHREFLMTTHASLPESLPEILPETRIEEEETREERAGGERAKGES